MKKYMALSFILTAVLAVTGCAARNNSSDAVEYADKTIQTEENISETEESTSGEEETTTQDRKHEDFDAQTGATPKTDEDMKMQMKGGMGKGGMNSGGNSVPIAQINGSAIDTAELFSKRDLEQNADTSAASKISVSDNKDINITAEGVYVISGTAENCTINVNAPDDAKVQLVLDGVKITNKSVPAIYVTGADKVFITTTDSINTLTETGEFYADGNTNIDGVIFSKKDITFNGVGTLNITSDANAVVAKDDLKITGGMYNITAKKDAFEANDSISVSDGTFNIKVEKNVFQCKNNESADKGYIYISGGTFDLDTGNDGIQAVTIAQIDGGNFKMKSAEGIEATYVQINGGNISIDSWDDGINAASKCEFYCVAVQINAGEITINMAQGDTDAIDANGSIFVNGGTIDITAPTSSFDYDVSAEYNGGTIIINGKQVDEIPQSMMGGGHGMGGRGKFGTDFENGDNIFDKRNFFGGSDVSQT